MDPMTPVHGTGTLLAIAAVAVAVLLVLIIALRMHAFVALVLVSMATAIVAGVPVVDVPMVAIGAFGSTLGAVAIATATGAVADTEILNVSYDPTREFYREYNELFADWWEGEGDFAVEVSQSHGGSGG